MRVCVCVCEREEGASSLERVQSKLRERKRKKKRKGEKKKIDRGRVTERDGNSSTIILLLYWNLKIFSPYSLRFSSQIYYVHEYFSKQSQLQFS